MKQRDQIDNKVEETLNSLDGLSRAKANPFLFTRVEARLRQSKSTWELVTAYVSRPVVALVMLCLVVLSNSIVVYRQSAPQEPVVDQAQLALTEEYNIAVTSFYDDENPEP